MRLVLLLALAVCGCDAPDRFLWNADPGGAPLTTPLATGGTAKIRGFSHAYDVVSLSPQVATASYGEMTYDAGSDAFGRKKSYTDRYLTVTGVSAGTAELDVRPRGDSSISQRLVIAVEDAAALRFTRDFRVFFIDDHVLAGEELALVSAGGGPMEGLGPISCTATRPLFVADSDCTVRSNGLGDGVLTATAVGIGVSVDVPLHVAQPLDVRRIDFGPLDKSGVFPSMLVIAQTDFGPAKNGEFQCVSDVADDVLLTDSSDSDIGARFTIYAKQQHGPRHITCKLGGLSATTTVDL